MCAQSRGDVGETEPMQLKRLFAIAAEDERKSKWQIRLLLLTNNNNKKTRFYCFLRDDNCLRCIQCFDRSLQRHTQAGRQATSRVPRRSVLASSPRLDLPSKHLLWDGSMSVTDVLSGWNFDGSSFFDPRSDFQKNKNILHVVKSTVLIWEGETSTKFGGKVK